MGNVGALRQATWTGSRRTLHSATRAQWLSMHLCTRRWLSLACALTTISFTLLSVKIALSQFRSHCSSFGSRAHLWG